jgi:hypothetical protein
LREISSADGVTIAHGPGERREVAIGEHGLGQNLPGTCTVQQIHQFFATWTGGSVMFTT